MIIGKPTVAKEKRMTDLITAARSAHDANHGLFHMFDNIEIKDDDTATETGICCPNFDLSMQDNFKCIIEGANGFRPMQVPLPPIVKKCEKGFRVFITQFFFEVIHSSNPYSQASRENKAPMVNLDKKEKQV